VVLLSFLLLEFLSCLVIVRPNQQAVFTQFGIIRNRILGPGIHLKAPWPIGSAFIYNTGEVRRVHAGSHRTTNRGDQIYRSGIPILWTNRHGISNEELIIISSPTNLIHDAEKSGGKIRFEKTAPSISLVGTDIVVEYNVDNLLHYIQSSDNPERLLYNFARSCASRLLFRYDIDALFCEDRLDLAEELKFIIQKTCNSHNLGINILHVGVTAVHPPLDVAQSFEETVTAMQERETSIQQARQASLLQQVETAGSIEDFNKMIALINDSERGTLVTSSTESKRLFRNVGGKVSKILSEAFAYRWSREHKERGKTERFSQESKLDKIALKKYRYDRYLAVLENGLEYSKKVILTDDCDDVIIRMNALQDGIKRIEISDELLE
jgi:regulator of protease activity HflC (stomatin/prohibitin superfamily)